MVCGANERFYFGANELPIGAKAMRRIYYISKCKYNVLNLSNTETERRDNEIPFTF